MRPPACITTGPWPRSAKRPLAGDHEHAEGDIDHAPVDQLTTANGPNRAQRDQDWREPICNRTGSAVPQPQPLSPAAFASASATQHASASAGAGPPQQPAPVAESVVLQTPVSGNTSSTRSAAAASPLSIATTDRACS